MKPELNIANLAPVGRGSSKASQVAKNSSETFCASCSANQNTLGSQPAAPSSRAAAFKKIVESVIKANKKAKVETEDPASPQTPDAQALIQSLQNTPITDNINLEALLKSISEDFGMPAANGENAAETATALVQNALKIVSQLMHLNVAQGFQDVKLDNPSDGLKDQLAEIINVLKGIDGLLTEASRTNQSLTINGAAFDPTQIVAAEKIVRVETFHIQMALSMAGISGDVAQRIAQANNQPSTDGIVSATSPAQVSMPPLQVLQALSGGLDTSGNTAETRLQVLAATLQESASTLEKSVLAGKIALVAVKPQADGVVTAQTAAQANTAQNSTGPDAGAFDAKTLRTMLKIDATHYENKAAAGGAEKLNLSDMTKTLFAKNLGAPGENREEKVNPLASDAGISGGAASTLFKPSDAAALAGKSLEESVITQLTDKVSAAVKTGVTEIRLLLRPESLGEMRVKLTLDGDVVMAKIYVENQQVKHIIETNMQSLKDSLAQHNLQTGSFDVNVGSGSQDFDRQTALAGAATPTEGIPGRTEEENGLKPAETIVAGRETGRKYGSNTVEYFA